MDKQQTSDAEQHPDDDRLWQFSLGQLCAILVTASVAFGMARQWPGSYTSLFLFAVVGSVGLLASATVASSRGISRPGQWLVGGIGFAIAAHNVWAVESLGGSEGMSGASEYGWPFTFLLTGSATFQISAFFAERFLANILFGGLFLVGVLRFAKTLEGTWNLVPPTRQAVMIALLFGPAAMIYGTRLAGPLEQVVMVVLGFPVCGAIIWGICQSSQGLARLDAEDDREFDE